MLTSTKTAVRAILRADATVDETARCAIEAAMCDRPTPGAAGPVLLRRREVAALLKVNPRTVDNLRLQGLLRPVVFPGRIRCAGFRQADVMALIDNRTEG